MGKVNARRVGEMIVSEGGGTVSIAEYRNYLIRWNRGNNVKKTDIEQRRLYISRGRRSLQVGIANGWWLFKLTLLCVCLTRSARPRRRL
jgi:hypothetical protein